MPKHLPINQEISLQNILHNFIPTVDGNRWEVRQGDMFYQFQTYTLELKGLPTRNILLIKKYDLSGKRESRVAEAVIDFSMREDFYQSTKVNFNQRKEPIPENQQFIVEGSLFNNNWAIQMNVMESLRRTWEGEGPEMQYVRYSAKVASLAGINLINELHSKSLELSFD